MFSSPFEYQKPEYKTKLNLVALMDIFTILVFFLLLNTGEADRLENAEFIDLPDSSTATSPHEDLVVMIGEEAIWVGEKKIAELEEILKSKEAAIEPLSKALADYRERRGELNSYEKQNGLALTIMGDRAVPFGLLKSVMVTCRLENFRDLSLAVNQVASPAPARRPSTSDLASRTELGR